MTPSISNGLLTEPMMQLIEGERKPLRPVADLLVVWWLIVEQRTLF